MLVIRWGEGVSMGAVLGTMLVILVGCGHTCRDLHAGAATDDVALLETAAADGVDLACVDAEGWSPLHTAARGGRLRALAWLLEHGAALEARGAVGRSPLYEAAKYGQREAARVLIERGAIVDARSDARITPLIVAAQMADRPMMELLLDHGADINAASDAGKTPLAQFLDFSPRDDDEMVRWLVSRGAWVDVHDDLGWTPLLHSSRRGLIRVARALLEAGANPSAVRNDGAVPLAVAERNGHPELAALLREHHAWHPAPRPTLGAPSEPLRRGAVVVARSGSDAPALGTRCEATLRAHTGHATFNCQLEVRCGALSLYGGDAGYLVCEAIPGGFRALDAMSTPVDTDPSAMIDTVSRRAFVDTGLRAPSGSSTQLLLDDAT